MKAFIKDAYALGFADRCVACGVNVAALLKDAQEKSKQDSVIKQVGNRLQQGLKNYFNPPAIKLRPNNEPGQAVGTMRDTQPTLSDMYTKNSGYLAGFKDAMQRHIKQAQVTAKPGLWARATAPGAAGRAIYSLAKPVIKKFGPEIAKQYVKDDPSVVTGIIKSDPSIVTDYMQKNPQVVNQLISQYGMDYVKNNPQILKQFAPELMKQFFSGWAGKFKEYLPFVYNLIRRGYGRSKNYLNMIASNRIAPIQPVNSSNTTFGH